jgi:transposase
MISMPRPCTPLPHDTEKKLRLLLRTKAKTARDAKRIQCVLHRVAEHYTAEKTGRLVGCGEATVKRIWSAYLRDGEASLIGEKRGRVRSAAHLTMEEEQALLRPIRKKAVQGHVTTARDIHAAHSKKVGKLLDETVTYRLLKRHGWRKIVPLPHHPKGDSAAREEFRAFFPQGGHQGENRGSSAWSPLPADVPG